MAKRGAGSELNDANWDVEEEPEEAGVFNQAPDDVLGQRVIKKAKRRVGESLDGPKTSAFTGFSGFMTKTSQPSSNLFSGLNKPVTNSSASSVKASGYGGAASVNGNGDQKGASVQTEKKDSSSYLSSLKSLNESVLGWIKQHVEQNPYIILTPIFKDYEKYLQSIELEKSRLVFAAKGENTSNRVTGMAASEPAVSVSSVPVNRPKPGEAEEDTSKAKPVLFGQTVSESSTAVGFSFVSSSSPATVKEKTPSSGPTAGFSFGLGTTGSSSSSMFGKPTFSFSNSSSTSGQGAFVFGKSSSSQETTPAAAVARTEDEDAEEYQPPKPEVTEVVEADALYSKRCKLYYQKDGQWVDRGVGNIHLKPLPDDKTQILVRADTNLGNVLLNVLLSATMPVSRQGKNNVFLVCVPNPAVGAGLVDGTPCPMLIRVKEEKDADELLGKIEERKKLL